MVGLGIDLVAISRIAELDRRYGPRFREKVMAPGEVASSIESLAGLWAAKEAVAKALGCGFRGFGPVSVAIYRDLSGAPKVTLLGAAADVGDKLEVGTIHVSISHDLGLAVACAVALRRSREV
ncbi:MAG TPA: holo-ACP synthase [Bacillota bacterium]|nr:holo-ACP synthase [Bacillota bacterium]